MGWHSYIYPQTIARLSSRHNCDIRVVEERGRPKLLVAGSPQSGPYIEKMWRKVLAAFRIPKDLDPKSILVLGVAGGTVITVLRQMYPHVPVTAVDIDKTMIDIGKKYFGLDSVALLRTYAEDAKVFVDVQIQKGHHYGLIIVDLFIGRHIPGFVDEEAFWRSVARLLTKRGVVILNYLRENEYRDKSNILLDKLRQIFHSVNTKEIFLNCYMVARRE